jgi:hypothetical protein
MKRSFVILLVCLSGLTKAQEQSIKPQLKGGIGYAHDFPGLNGYTLVTEYLLPANSWLEAGIGAKYVNLSGYPRTPEIKEFTRATTLDFTLYLVPMQTDRHLISLGLGYSFSFYDIQRAYPIANAENPKQISWLPQPEKGRVSGANLVLDYEYHLLNSPVNLGFRAAMYKTYQTTYFVGPTIGYLF